MLLQRGYAVTVVDDLLFGGESLLAYFSHPNFRFIKGDVCDPDVLQIENGRLKIPCLGSSNPTPQSSNLESSICNPIAAVVHLAAIVGFPACQAVGKQVAWRYNVESVQRVFELAESIGAKRFIFSSTYSNYGLTKDGNAVTEDSPLYPQSLYAETKIASEEWLLAQSGQSGLSHQPTAISSGASRCSPLIFRFATLFGVSPRTRFDLIVNQFVLEAMTKRELIIYQRGYSRSSSMSGTLSRGSCWAWRPRRRRSAARSTTWGRTTATTRRTRSSSW